ncbi:MAG: WecB/TagA/CpsF family glycosyltransferase [Granulosicoccus sp.]
MGICNKLPESIKLLGFHANPGSLDDYLHLTKNCIESDTKASVLYHNLHSLYSFFVSEDLRKYYSGTTVLVDGMPVIWLMKLCGKAVNREHRVTYVDFIIPLIRLARENNWNVYHIGQTADIQRLALEKIRLEVPGIKISGHHGYFDQTPESADSLKIVDAVNAGKTHILLVGLGAPNQEAWIHAHREQIEAPAVFTCGACMEYVAGAVKTPPRWLGKLGLEWSFRLMENPKRFAFRYLVEPFLLALILLKNGVGQLFAGKQP